jgi:hypothetical protein
MRSEHGIIFRDIATATEPIGSSPGFSFSDAITSKVAQQEGH